MKRLLAILIMLASPAGARGDVPPEVLQAESARIAAMEKVKPTVLAIFSAGGEGGGSGVVISPDGYALTNFHVVQPCGDAMKCGMADGRVYDAVIVGLDPTGDVALIKLFGRDDFPVPELGDSDAVRQGDACFAMGNPFLLATDFQPTVTCGILSGTHRYQYPAGTILEYTDCLQTDASINPGNSGGPLFDAAGRLIGINGRASFDKRGRVCVGAGYAISINQIKNFMGSLRSGRIVDHATLGARVGFDDQNRVVVIDLAEQSDAFRRGLRYGDEILSFGGRTISTPNGFKNILGIYPKGWRVPLVFRHEGKREEQLVRLSALHGEGELAQALARPQKPPDEKPKPDRPKDSKPKPKPKPKDEDIPIPKPGEHGRRMGHPAAPLPQVVKDHLEKRPGFANYYFNKLNRDRVLAAWRARGNFRTAPGEWTLAGPLPRGAEYRFTLSDKAAVLKLPTTEIAWSDKEPIASTLVPTGSGGLLPALWLWRRLAVLEPDQFGEVTYLGTAPVPGAAEPADVLLALAGGVECRFYFDSKTGLLLLIEMYPEEHADPCELYFRDYREVQGRAAPGTIEARYGDDAFGTFQVKSLQWGGGT